MQGLEASTTYSKRCLRGTYSILNLPRRRKYAITAFWVDLANKREKRVLLVSERATAVGRVIHYHTSWSVLTTRYCIHYSCADAYGMTSIQTYLRHCQLLPPSTLPRSHKESFDECMDFNSLTGSPASRSALDCGVRAFWMNSKRAPDCRRPPKYRREPRSRAGRYMDVLFVLTEAQLGMPSRVAGWPPGLTVHSSLCDPLQMFRANAHGHRLCCTLGRLIPPARQP